MLPSGKQWLYPQILQPKSERVKKKGGGLHPPKFWKRTEEMFDETNTGDIHEQGKRTSK